MMTFALSYLVFGGLLCGLRSEWSLPTGISSRKRSQRDWHDLVARLQRVDFAGVSTVAVDYLTPASRSDRSGAGQDLGVPRRISKA